MESLLSKVPRELFKFVPQKGLKDVEVIEFGATKKEDKEGAKKKEKSEESS